jgi:hypothetical protein
MGTVEHYAHSEQSRTKWNTGIDGTEPDSTASRRSLRDHHRGGALTPSEVRQQGRQRPQHRPRINAAATDAGRVRMTSWKTFGGAAVHCAVNRHRWALHQLASLVLRAQPRPGSDERHSQTMGSATNSWIAGPKWVVD